VASAEEIQLGKHEILLELNARVHEAARRFEGAEPERDLWDFTCECGAPDCRVPVSLTLAEYEALRAEESPILAAGHQEDGVETAQAELRQKHAERNRRHT